MFLGRHLGSYQHFAAWIVDYFRLSKSCYVLMTSGMIFWVGNKLLYLCSLWSWIQIVFSSPDPKGHVWTFATTQLILSIRCHLFKFLSIPLKPLIHSESNLTGMFLWWTPKWIVSNDPFQDSYKWKFCKRINKKSPLKLLGKSKSKTWLEWLFGDHCS